VLTDLQSHLSVSADGMHTWQPIDAPILALTGSEQTVKQYWARVDSGGHLVLLAEVGAAPVWDSTTPEPEDTLWLSRDAGTHWTQLPAPLMSGFTARASADGQSWLICGSSRALETSAGRQAMNACSADSGETWTTRPLLRTCEACGEPLGDGNLESGGTYLASDGSLVQVAEDQTKGTLALYQLPANSSQWQYLGPMPDGDTVMYAPTATGGLLWACSAGTVVGSPLDGIIGGAGNSTGVIYTAIYPG
jgi:hypothetical protein